jgi:hypothetical protein
MTKVINILTIKVTENGIDIKPEDIGNLFIAFGILENFKKLKWSGPGAFYKPEAGSKDDS